MAWIYAGGMECKLCLKDRTLRRSHIVPEFLHKPLYDEKHRARRLDIGAEVPGYLQKGLRELLLCDDCEQLLNDAYEKPFLAEWREGRLLPQRLLPPDIHYVTGVDYATIKLFLLSVLFRAGVSSLGAFAGVTLGPKHEARLRAMVHGRDPGGPTEYPIVGTFTVDDAGTVLPSVASPVPLRISGHRAYAFMFGGCEWTYFVSGHPVDGARGIGIRPDGVACFDAMPLRDARTASVMRQLRAERTQRRKDAGSDAEVS